MVTLLDLRVALNTGAGLDDPARVHEFQVMLDQYDRPAPPQASTNTFVDTDADVRVTGAGSSETPIPFDD